MYERRNNFTLHRCMACGKLITYNFAICSDCEEIYGKSALGWPDWIRRSWNSEQRWRRRETKDKNGEVLFSDLYPPIERRHMKYEDEDDRLDSLRIRELLSSLPEDMGLIVGLKSMGYNQGDIAGIMQTSRTTIGTRLNEVKRLLIEEGLF